LIPSIPGDDPLSNGQIGLFKTQLTERKIWDYSTWGQIEGGHLVAS
jgi:hypothetical protein